MADGLKVGDVYASISLKDEGFTSGLTKARESLLSLDKEGATASASVVKSQATVGTSATRMAAQHVTATKSIVAGFGGMVKSAASMATGLAGYYATVGAAGAFLGVIKAGVQYQDTLNQLGAVTGATSAQMAQMSRLAIQLGNDVKLPNTSAADAASAMLELSKAGLSVNDAMAAAPGALELAAAGQLDEATAAQDTANALNEFHLAGTQAMQVSDLFAAAANAASGDVQDFADALSYTGGSAHNLGVPIQDVVTLLAQMANSGIQGTHAGTELNDVFTKLAAPTKEAAAELQTLGINVFTTGGQLKPIPQVIDQFHDALAKLTPQQQQAALSMIFMQQGARAANVIFSQSSTAFDQMRTAVTKQGAAAQLAAAYNQGLGGELRGISNTLQTETLQAFLAVQPKLEQFGGYLETHLGPDMTALGGGLSRVGGFVQQLQKMGLLVPILAGVAGGVAAWAGYQVTLNTALAIFGIQKWVTSLGEIPALISLITGATASWGDAQAFLDLVMDANPIGVVILAGTALVGIIALILTHTQQIGQAFSWLGTQAQNLYHLLPTGAQTAIMSVIGWFERLPQTVGAVFSAIGTFISTGWATITGIFSTAIGAIEAFLNQWWVVDLLNLLKLPFALAWLGIQAIWGVMVAGTMGAVNLIRGIVLGVWGMIETDALFAWGLIQSYVLNPLVALWGLISPPLNSIWSLVTTIFQDIQGAVSGPMDAISQKVGGVFSALGTTVHTGLVSMGNTVVGDLNSVIDVIDGFLGGINGSALGKMGIHFDPIPHVPKFAKGGIVPGQGNRDSVMAMLMPGEVVLNRTAVRDLGGAEAVNKLNGPASLSNQKGLFVGGGGEGVGSYGGQCVEWVEAVEGVHFPVAYAAQMSAYVNSQTPAIGNIFVSEIPPYGHTGIVIGNNTVEDSNWVAPLTVGIHKLSDVPDIAGYINLGGGLPSGIASSSVGAPQTDITGILKGLVGGLNLGGLAGWLGQFPRNLLETIVEDAGDFIKNKIGDVGSWVGHDLQALGFDSGFNTVPPGMSVLYNGTRATETLGTREAFGQGGDSQGVVDAIERLTDTVVKKVLGKLTVVQEAPVNMQQVSYQLALAARGGKTI